MKKILLLLTLTSLLLALTSCKVNRFTTTVDVPWYFIAIPVALIFVVSYFILMNITFVCPECKTEFKPKWYQLSVCFHFMGKRYAKCPKCGSKGFFERKR